MTFVKTAILLPDLSLEVHSYDIEMLGATEFRFKRDRNFETLEVVTIAPKDVWCISVHDSEGNVIKKLTCDAFR